MYNWNKYLSVVKNVLVKRILNLGHDSKYIYNNKSVRGDFTNCVSQPNRSL